MNGTKNSASVEKGVLVLTYRETKEREEKIRVAEFANRHVKYANVVGTKTRTMCVAYKFRETESNVQLMWGAAVRHREDRLPSKQLRATALGRLRKAPQIGMVTHEDWGASRGESLRRLVRRRGVRGCRLTAFKNCQQPERCEDCEAPLTEGWDAANWEWVEKTNCKCVMPM